MATRPDPVAGTVGYRILQAYCGQRHRKEVEVRVEGKANVPADGPTLLVARHVHNFFDGCAIDRALPRRLHAVVSVDWAPPGPQRSLLAHACRLIGWPAVMRPGKARPEEQALVAKHLREATRESVRLLQDGRMLLVFPEGYPNIDPHPTPKDGLDDWLPFEPGFARIARIAQGDGQTQVAVVPTGFHYAPLPGDRWRVILRFGEPRRLAPGDDLEAFVRAVEAEVRALSRPA